MDDQIAMHLVTQARDGDQVALDQLITHCIPMVYNIVGRALMRPCDVDDVVQETLLAVVRGIGGLREVASFRSWLVAITTNKIRDHVREQSQFPKSSLDDCVDVADPGADFVDMTLTQLGLSGQRREVALATRWLDPDDRRLLPLWWLEAAGRLIRADLVGALGIDSHHTTVRLARMKSRLETARMIVRALLDSPRCLGLQQAAEGWRGQEAPLWRKRFARHIRECPSCTSAASGLVPAESLLVDMAPVPQGAHR